MVDGILILVREPAAYIRSEMAALARVARDAAHRKKMLAETARIAGLPLASIERHRDVLDAEIARAEMFLDLLVPAANAVATLPESANELATVRRSGWTVDTLYPYLLRDWTNSAELNEAISVISEALKETVPDTRGKSVAVAGCGAGGLLAEMPANFERVVGFDLTLPILMAARRILNGGSIDLALPRCIHSPGRITLCKRGSSAAIPHADLLVMDAMDTAFSDGSIDCVITSFMVDLMPDPRKLAAEIHRVLAEDGIWINYGPSGPLKALWRFDQTETAAFLETAGFSIVKRQAHRATYLDLSREFHSWSFQNHMCYLTAARKGRQSGESQKIAPPDGNRVAETIPQHFPNATVVQRQRLGGEADSTIAFRHERIPGRVESFEVDNAACRMIALVDGKRTVREIAQVLKREDAALPVEGTLGAFAHFFAHGLLAWN